MTAVSQEIIDARIATVEEHIRRENEHNLEAVMATFGEAPYYDDQAWGELHDGLKGVQTYYADLIAAVPDLVIDVKKRYINEDSITLEVVISGTQLGPWRGLPATGRKMSFPLCAFYLFDQDNKLKAERIYYDRATVLRQMGMYHEPDTWLGKLTGVLTHPWTILKALFRKK